MLHQLRKIVEKVSQALDFQQALHALVDETQQVLAVDSCSVYLLHEQASQLILMAGSGDGYRSIKAVALPLNRGLRGLIAKSDDVVNLEDLHQHPSYQPIPDLDESNLHAFLGVPIVHQRKTLGILIIQRQSKALFSENEESFLVTLAAQLAMVIAQADAKNLLRVSRLNQIEQFFQGIAAAPGLAIAPAWVWMPHVELEHVEIHKAEFPSRQLGRLDLAVKQVGDELEKLAVCLKETLPGDSLAIFDIYRYLLRDPLYIDAIRDEINNNNYTAATAVKIVSDRLIMKFSQMEDLYLKGRAVDVRDVARRLLSHLVQHDMDTREFPERLILVAEEISSVTLAEIPPGHLLGIVSARGSHHSHTAILAKALGIPAVMGLSLPLDELHGSEIILDGYAGELIINPSRSDVNRYQRFVENKQAFEKKINQQDQGPVLLKDGTSISLQLNVGLTDLHSQTIPSFACGVGLYRSEYPFMLHDGFPSEHEQLHCYRKILTSFRGQNVRMRVLDAGGDKLLSYFPVVESNPSLGLRGVRLLLDHPEIYLLQLKAMLKANLGIGNLSIMLPMVTTLGEIQESRKLLQQAWKDVLNECGEEGDEIGTGLPPLGVMLEVPSLLYQFDELAQEVDFISIGTNDLTQYLLALDRNNARVAQLYDALHPVLLRAIEPLPGRVEPHGIPLAVCGEIAGDPIGILALIAMGYRDLSMNQGNLARCKYLLQHVALDELKPLLQEGLTYPDSARLRELFSSCLERHGLGGFLRAGA